MTTMWKSIIQTLAMKPPNSFRCASKFRPSKLNKQVLSSSAIFVAVGTVAIYTVYQCKNNVSVLAHRPKNARVSKLVRLTSKEKRFIRFASVEYNGQLYMTPRDFLDAVMEADPRRRMKRKALTATEIKYMKENTPTLAQGSPKLFRNIRDNGIISYTEYLFLLSVLIKPQSGFRIAFDMFDMDGNQRIDKNEFLMMEKIFSRTWKGKRRLAMSEDAKKVYVEDEQGLQRRHLVDTTLIIHYFGPKGNEELKFEDFRWFMLDLQAEVLELEFSEFSKGFPTISEEDFAKILLRYTYLDANEYNTYLDRLLDRIKESKGITFKEFYVFFQFLNNLEDFSVAIRMYTLADHSISIDEFHRAVRICAGTSLSQHIVHTVFSIFDRDGDGLLNYSEFIAIMKDRLHRGFKSYAKNKGWGAFKNCLKQEMKSPM